MKQKLKMFYECMRPNVALLMVTILVVSLLSVGMVEETKAADLGGRTNWRDAEGVNEKSFEGKGVTTQNSYTEYLLEDGEYVPNTVSINSAAELGSRENPYAIESEEDLILFGKLQNSETTGKYFMLTKDVYDMQGNSKYMSPLFSSSIYHSGLVISTPFEGNLIGNNAVIKNAYIVDQYEQTSCNTGFFSSINNAAIWDLNIENSTFNITQVSSIGGFTYQTTGACALVNCNISYFINNTGGSSVSIGGFSSSGNPRLYNSSATLVADKSTITIAENISVSIGDDENIFAEMRLTSSNSIYVNKAKISSRGNIVTVYKNGAFTIKNIISEDVVINDTPCTPNTTYNPIILDYADGTFSSKVYESGTQHTLDYPLKPSAVFLGWTGEGLTEPTKDVVIPEDFVGACTYVANWGEPINIETCDITFVDGNAYTYTGNAIQPKFLVKDGDKILEEGIDYEITCYNNVEISSTDIAFSPKAVVEGKGQYTGRKDLTFTIKKAIPLIQTMPTASKIQEGQTLASSTLTGGIALSGIATNDIYGSSVDLVEGTFNWKDGTIIPTLADSEVTKYTVVFTPDDTDNFETVEMDLTIIVEKLLISLYDCDIRITDGPAYSYTGEEVKPAILVKYKDTILEENKDYKITYTNNVNAATDFSTNAPTVVVEGIGKYTGSKSFTFTIEKASPLIQTVPTASKIQEGESLATSTFTGGVALGVCDVSGNRLNSLSGTFSWKDNTFVPTLLDSGVTKYTVVFTPEDTDNYNILEFDITVDVEKKPLINIETCSISFINENIYIYNGQKIAPKIVIKNGDKILEKGKDYKVSYMNNINAATMDSSNAPTVFIEGIGDYIGSTSLTFTIEKATPVIEVAPTASKIQEGEALSASVLTGGIVSQVIIVSTNSIAFKGTFSWKDDSIVPTLADSGVTKYTVIFTPNDITNYNTVEGDTVVIVEKKSSSNQPGSGDVDPEKPGSNDSDTQKPGSGDSGVQKPANQAQIGKSTTDTKNTATYIVTSSEMNAVEVAYVAPTKETKNVTIPETVTLKDNIVAKVTSIEAGAFKKNTKIQTITISKNVKTIGNEAFRGCKNLKKVKGVKNVTKIGKNAFANCNKLSSVTLGSNVTTIGEKAFYKCTVLKKITISKNVTSIGKSAFEGCKNLKTVNIKTTKLTKKNVKKNAFKGTSSKAKFDVPNSKKKTYASILKARGASKKATIK